jgi:hypothetical protein
MPNLFYKLLLLLAPRLKSKRQQEHKPPAAPPSTTKMETYQQTPTRLHGASTREAIVDALYRAVMGIDLNDRPLLDSAFIKSRADAQFVFNGNEIQGMDNIMANVLDPVMPLDTTHAISNVRVDHKEGSNEGFVSAYSMAQHYPEGAGSKFEGKHLLTGCMYWVDVVKESGEEIWRVKRWAMKVVWMEGDQAVIGRH